ncbi:TetR family transcriptional regulator [Gordonia paraffinivorans]|uniref:TetR family transcriptional regulator n=2 Tax=Gordonia paraffinivorans TaxID=175628 RepID=A0ABQ0IH21_9ACTN|nr:TetR/AcrR family transcriptional regulator [Gordonia paraffinivorans]MBY4572325.1 TetR family transcriptional regulator [Gordonia paraffinivorans]MCD2144325.1 TetR/AcrR family transcriptional regulator [Gordonia paraffinivorans]PWD44131.1 TetR family transcriptional regulator [Gordonia paraffinivorans]VFA82229.1 HTH-type transcriptional repressor KstR2 [Gordonia paraffinivorans]GAC82890.1 putative TetR family transcriptional regulator [Gordonia paraffinivorans NBRC 108238]
MEPVRADEVTEPGVGKPTATHERPRTRRDEIVEAAARYFAEHGYANAGMRDIAEAVGMRGASLYNHFHSKEEILYAIALRMTQDPQEDLLLLDGDGGPAQRLTALVEAHVRRLARHRVEHLVALRELNALTPEHRRVVTDYRKYYQRRIRDVIEAGTRLGVFTTRDPYRSAVAVLDLMNGISWWLRDDHDVDQLVADYVDFTIRGVLHHDPGS